MKHRFGGVSIIDNRREVLDFIRNFSSAEDTFLYGCCFWFTAILSERFGGETLYNPVENHFVQRIHNTIYDVRGDVTELYRGTTLYPWSSYCNFDPSDWSRVYRDCVLKTEG